MLIKIDLSDVEACGKRAEEEFDRLHSEMLARVARGAAYERQTHAYRNRTGNLQRSTQARTTENSRDVSAVTLEMDEDYASYVVARRLSNIEGAAKDVALDLEEMFAEMARRIGGA